MELSVGDFVVNVIHETVHLTRGEEKFSFAPGEGENVFKAVSCAMSCRNIKNLPPRIGVGVFLVEFRDDDCLLRRDHEGQGISFTFAEAEQLMEAIDMGVNKVIDQNRIRGGAAKGFNSIRTLDVP